MCVCEMLKEKTREWEERNRGAGEKAKQGGGVVELGRRLGSEHVKGEGEKREPRVLHVRGLRGKEIGEETGVLLHRVEKKKTLKSMRRVTFITPEG